MCGINGIFGIENFSGAGEAIRNMNRVLTHRGPDADGFYESETIVLGHRRLSIIDLSEASNQPFISSDGNFILAYNGELYNYKELKKELPDYDFRTNSDTEVILASYQKWGVNCLQHFNGMFAFAIWDKNASTLFIARDRMGIKPLYYFRTGELFFFSSEIKSLLASGMIRKKVNERALCDYLRYQTVHAPYTIIEGIHVLMPGHYMIFSEDEQYTRQYWDITETYSRSAGKLSEREIKEEVNNLLGEAVRKRLIADVPSGAFLSGGIDSSAIVGLMRRHSNGNINTFNISFAEEEFSEAKYAKLVAEKFQTSHTEIKLSAGDFLSMLPEAMAALDHPSGDGPNTWVISKATKQAGISMALSGLGGDELFAGYELFSRTFHLKDKKWLLSFPSFFRSWLASAYVAAKPSIQAQKMKELFTLEYFDAEYLYPVNRRVLLDNDVAKLLGKRRLPADAVFEIVEDGVGYGKPGFSMPWLSKISYAEINTYLQNVLLRDTDQMSMAHSLEVRVPFLDHQLAEFVFGIPDTVKFPHSPKKLLIESLGDLLPPEIINRPKMGFTFPWETWLLHDLKGWAEERIYNLMKRDYINANALEILWKRFLQKDPRVSWSRLWYLIVLEDWLMRNEIE